MNARYSLTAMLLHLLLMANSASAAQMIIEEVLGLIAFKSELRDPFFHLASWSVDNQSPCSWRFVECNSLTGRVVHLSLSGLSLSGKLSKGLRKLEALEVLDISKNYFNGSIGSHFVDASRLQLLNLSGNTFSSSLPLKLFNLKRLEFLDISDNHFSGVLPDDAFINSSNLRYLSLAGNYLHGIFPNSITACSLLNTLNVSSNYFSSGLDFSSGFWQLRSLRTLDISHNFFQGTISGKISRLHFLEVLALRNNWFWGSIPEDIGQCRHLRVLDMSENQFTGELPNLLSQLPNLIYLNLSNNRLSGGFPSWVFNDTTHLQHLDLSNNGLAGSLPPLARCYALQVIRTRNNSLTGRLPEGWFNLPLEELDLSQNNFTGIIPSFSNSFFSSSIRSLDLSSNNLRGPLPRGWEKTLRYLNVSWNHLESRIPEEVGYLKTLDLRNNHFFGEIPSHLCEYSNLRILLLDSNSLTGPIPSDIGRCFSLYALGLSNNSLRGRIPRSISKMRKLKILRLEFNNLDGAIPNELGSLKNLLELNVSYNKLSGKLPVDGIFPKLDASSLRGNLGLCSTCNLDVPKPLVVDFNQIPSEKASENHILTVSSMIAVSAAALIVVGVMVVCLMNSSSRKIISERVWSDPNFTISKLILFGLQSPLPEGMMNPDSILDRAILIGGNVYKLRLGSHPREVAMKKMDPLILSEDFEREIRALGKLRHPNVNPVNGYFLGPNLRVVVSDYAPNGCMNSKVLDGAVPWNMRWKVIVGTAEGLAYLHGRNIIHGGVKPSNVLLDMECNPMVSDFGLGMRRARDGRYSAPELAWDCANVTEKCDVYGFGVFAVAMVTGRKNVDVDSVREDVARGDWMECVDCRMGDWGECLVFSVLRIGLICASPAPSSRPSMPHVLRMFQAIGSSPLHLQMFLHEK